MPITVERTPFDEIEALQDIGQDNQSDVVQLGRGKMTGEIAHLKLDPTFGISTGSFSLSMRATGVLSHARWCLGFLLKSNGPAFGHHHQFKAGDLVIAAPGEERHIKFQNNTQYVAPFVTEEELERFLAQTPGALEVLLQHRLSVLPTPLTTAISNIEEMRTTLQALTEQGHPLPDKTIEFYRRGILTMTTAPLRQAAQYRGRHIPNPDTLVRDIEYYYANVTGPVHVSEICEEFGVHPRTLHRAYHDEMGMGPVAYYRRKRLNDVRAALREDGPGVTVKKVSIEHGFADPSRFAAAYRHLFGELPSETLRKHIIHRALPLLVAAGAAVALCLELQCECPLLFGPHAHD